jgi:hypothetical protein
MPLNYGCTVGKSNVIVADINYCDMVVDERQFFLKSIGNLGDELSKKILSK